MPDHQNTPSENPAASPAERWVVYLSKDRRILWADSQGPGAELPESVQGALTVKPGDSCPAALAGWNDLLDLAYATRMPQYGTHTITQDGKERLYTLKVFPDLTLDGELKGLIQVVERESGEAWQNVQKRTINALLDLTLSGVILYSPLSDRILNVNRRVAQQTGYSMAELENMQGTHLFGETGVAILRRIFQRMAKAGQGMIWGQELTITDHYGSVSRYLCSLRAIPEQPGPASPLAMVVSMDNSPADAASPVPTSPNHMFVFQAIRDSTWDYDFQKRVFHYSRTFENIFGPDGVEGGPGKSMESWRASVHPEDVEVTHRQWRKLLKKGERNNVQYRIRDTHGNWRWILSRFHAILNDHTGHPHRVIGSHMDITDCMHTEMNLVDAEERLRMIFTNAGIGIAVAGLDGLLASVNPALALMLGCDPENLEGHRISEFAHPDDQDEIRGILKRLVRGGRREAVLEKRLIRCDGKPIWVNFTATLSRKDLDGDRYVIVMIENVSERHDRQAKLLYRATHDILTGCWNRGVLLERLEQYLHLALRHKQPLTFCMCDLDHFKMVNDIHGHQMGDNVLVTFVKNLTAAVRDTDVIGRYGGEEFGIFFPNTTIEGAVSCMERARKNLMDTPFTDTGGEPFRVTATFGIAGVVPDTTVKSLLAAADAALYDGKEQGRNRVNVYLPKAGGA